MIHNFLTIERSSPLECYICKEETDNSDCNETEICSFSEMVSCLFVIGRAKSVYELGVGCCNFF